VTVYFKLLDMAQGSPSFFRTNLADRPSGSRCKYIFP
jgi:hypothetical protein